MSKALKAVADIGKKAAIKNTNFYSRYFFYQPKVPAKLLELKQNAQ